MEESQEHSLISKHATYFISGGLLHFAVVLVVGIIPFAPLPTKIVLSAACAVLLYFLAYRAVEATKPTYFVAFAIGVASATLIRQYMFRGWISANAFTVPLFYVPLLCAGIVSLALHRIKANA